MPLVVVGVIALVVFLAFGIPGLIVMVIAGIVVGLLACCGGKEKK